MPASRPRVLAIVLLLGAGCALFAACGGEDAGSQAELTLTGDELRDFVGSMLLTWEEIPGALEEAPPEEWRTDSEDGGGEPVAGLTLEGAGWLGTLSRPIIVRNAEDRTFTVGNTASAFTTSAGAADALDLLKESDVDVLGRNLVATTSATSYEVRDLDVDVGEDAWSVLLVGPAEVEGTQEELTLAMVGFRRGPILAVISTLGFVESGGDLVGQLARTVDERIQAGLEGLQPAATFAY